MYVYESESERLLSFIVWAAALDWLCFTVFTHARLSNGGRQEAVYVRDTDAQN